MVQIDALILDERAPVSFPVARILVAHLFIHFYMIFLVNFCLYNFKLTSSVQNSKDSLSKTTLQESPAKAIIKSRFCHRFCLCWDSCKPELFLSTSSNLSLNLNLQSLESSQWVFIPQVFNTCYSL